MCRTVPGCGGESATSHTSSLVCVPLSLRTATSLLLDMVGQRYGDEDKLPSQYTTIPVSVPHEPMMNTIQCMATSSLSTTATRLVSSTYDARSLRAPALYHPIPLSSTYALQLKSSGSTHLPPSTTSDSTYSCSPREDTEELYVVRAE